MGAQSNSLRTIHHEYAKVGLNTHFHTGFTSRLDLRQKDLSQHTAGTSSS